MPCEALPGGVQRWQRCAVSVAAAQAAPMGDQLGAEDDDAPELRLPFLSRALDNDWAGSAHAKQLVAGAMDADTADANAGVADSLNGETKPDPAKLARTAIIKQVSGAGRAPPPSSLCLTHTANIHKFSKLTQVSQLVEYNLFWFPNFLLLPVSCPYQASSSSSPQPAPSWPAPPLSSTPLPPSSAKQHVLLVHTHTPPATTEDDMKINSTLCPTLATCLIMNPCATSHIIMG